MDRFVIGCGSGLLVCVLACARSGEPPGRGAVDSAAVSGVRPGQDADPAPVETPAETPQWRLFPTMSGCEFKVATRPEHVELTFAWTPCKDNTPGCSELSALRDPKQLPHSPIPWIKASAVTEQGPWFALDSPFESNRQRLVITTPDGPPAFVLETPASETEGCVIRDVAFGDERAVVELLSNARSEDDKRHERTFITGLLAPGSVEFSVAARWPSDEPLMLPRYSVVGDVVMLAQHAQKVFRSSPETDKFVRIEGFRPGFTTRFDDATPDGAMLTTMGPPARAWFVPPEGTPTLVRTIESGGYTGFRYDDGQFYWVEWRGRKKDRYDTIELFTAPIARDARSLKPRRLAVLTSDELVVGDGALISTWIEMAVGDGIVAYNRPRDHEQPGIVLIDAATGHRRILSMPKGAWASEIHYVANGEIAFTQDQRDDSGKWVDNGIRRRRLDPIDNTLIKDLEPE